ncbi:hypothetical protein Bca101_022286 [Brassica carinata]
MELWTEARALKASLRGEAIKHQDEEDVEELEWVSRVVDDCSSQEVSLLLTQTHKTKPSFSSRIPVKPRTKRLRNSLTGDRVWPLVSTNQHAAGEQQWKKKKKRQELAVVFQRSCSHCGTNTTTPQWRTGPVGPKTLCNACGVRFKSGRLCPEYRPADSPTFSNEIHSNLHRKVLELRKSKELVEETGGAITKSDQVKFGSQVVEKT